MYLLETRFDFDQAAHAQSDVSVAACQSGRGSLADRERMREIEAQAVEKLRHAARGCKPSSLRSQLLFGNER